MLQDCLDKHWDIFPINAAAEIWIKFEPSEALGLDKIWCYQWKIERQLSPLRPYFYMPLPFSTNTPTTAVSWRGTANPSR